MKQPKSQTMTNNEFLSVITESFKAFLYKGTSRSTDKLKPLHGAIAEDIAFRLGNGYDVWSKGFYHDSEADIQGRYINKKVDITIKKMGNRLPESALNSLCKTIRRTPTIISKICSVKLPISDAIFVLISKFSLSSTNCLIIETTKPYPNGKHFQITIFQNIPFYRKII